MPTEVVNDTVDAVAPAGTVALAVVLAVVARARARPWSCPRWCARPRPPALARAAPCSSARAGPCACRSSSSAVWVALRRLDRRRPVARRRASTCCSSALICSIAWLVAALAFVAEDASAGPLPHRRAGQPARAPRAHADHGPAAAHGRRPRAVRGRRDPHDLPRRPHRRGEPVRVRGPGLGDRRARRAEHARQRLRRPAARLHRRDPRRGRRRGGGGVGPDRGDHDDLRRGAPVGRPAPGPAVDLLHDDAVPELDPARGRAARHGRARPRLDGPGRRHARTS